MPGSARHTGRWLHSCYQLTQGTGSTCMLQNRTCCNSCTGKALHMWDMPHAWCNTLHAWMLCITASQHTIHPPWPGTVDTALPGPLWPPQLLRAEPSHTKSPHSTFDLRCRVNKRGFLRMRTRCAAAGCTPGRVPCPIPSPHNTTWTVTAMQRLFVWSHARDVQCWVVSINC